MRIECLVVVYAGGRPINSKKQEIEIGPGYSRECIEQELVKIQAAANKKMKRAHTTTEMRLLSIDGVELA